MIVMAVILGAIVALFSTKKKEEPKRKVRIIERIIERPTFIREESMSRRDPKDETKETKVDEKVEEKKEETKKETKEKE